MENINIIQTPSDKYFSNVDEELKLLEGDKQRMAEYLKNEIYNLEWYIGVRNIIERNDHDSLDGFIDRVRTNPDLYRAFDDLFGYKGAQKPLLDVKHLLDVLQKLRSYSF